MAVAKINALSIPQLWELRQALLDERAWRLDGDRPEDWIRRLTDELLDSHILTINDRIAARNKEGLAAMRENRAKAAASASE